MLAYVFVYSPSRFRVGGSHPLKQLQPGQQISYEQARTALSAGNEGVIDRGVYGIHFEGSEVELSATEAQNTVDYDQIVAGKDDDWPWLTDPGSTGTVDPAMRQRVITAFPTLRAEDLRTFSADPRGV